MRLCQEVPLVRQEEQGALYQLVDNFTLFHYKFLENASDERYWTNSTNSSAMNAWRGIAFERVCLEHVPQIKRALGVSGVQSEVGAWSCPPDPEKGVHGSQVDLLIARKDQVVNLCEMKYSSGEYALTRAGEEAIARKVDDFLRVTGTRSSAHVTLVTTYGLKANAHSNAVQAVVTAEDLFG